MLKGALSLAECVPAYKVDCTLILHNSRQKRDFVLRTTLDSISVWKIKNQVSVSPYRETIGAVTKDAAIIEGDLWVFGVDATKPDDIFTAVKIGMAHHKVKASDIIGDVYVKNLNAEHESEMSLQALVLANKKLYSDVCSAVFGAAKLLGVQGVINFFVISSNINHKIPKDDLHQALRDGGASRIDTDDKIHLIKSSSNSGDKAVMIKQNVHLATFKI